MNFKILFNESNLLKALGVSLVVHLLLVWWFYSINDQSQLSQKEPNIKACQSMPRSRGRWSRKSLNLKNKKINKKKRAKYQSVPVHA